MISGTWLLVAAILSSTAEPVRQDTVDPHPRTTGPNEPIGPPPAELSYEGFYHKCAYFHGLPIIGSEKVDDRAFHVIVKTFGKLLARVPEASIQELVKAHSHYSIIAAVEGQTDLPEYWNLKNDPNTDWNKRGRGEHPRVPERPVPGREHLHPRVRPHVGERRVQPDRPQVPLRPARGL